MYELLAEADDKPVGSPLETTKMKTSFILIQTSITSLCISKTHQPQRSSLSHQLCPYSQRRFKHI